MDAKRAAPAGRAEEPDASPAAPPAPGREESPAAAYGPLELRRLRKDDGRALLVYARQPERP